MEAAQVGVRTYSRCWKPLRAICLKQDWADLEVFDGRPPQKPGGNVLRKRGA